MIAREREHEYYIQSKVVTMRSEITNCMRRNGIDGRLCDDILRGYHDTVIRQGVCSDESVTPISILKTILNKELM